MRLTPQVDGFRRMVRDFASEVQENDGLVVYVNLGAPGKEWDSVFDYHGASSLSFLPILRRMDASVQESVR